MRSVEITLFFSIFLELACSSGSLVAPSPMGQDLPEEKTRLRVAMFPWIPDSGRDGFQQYRKWIKDAFEKSEAGANVELVLADMDPGSGMFYDSDKVDQALQSKFDIVEIDTILLGEIVAKGNVRAWENGLPEGIHPAAITSVTLNEGIWGVPHWLCGFFVFTRDKEAAAAASSAEFVKRLSTIRGTEFDLLADWSGSWGFGAHYLTATASGTGQTSSEVLSGFNSDKGLDASTVAALAQLGSACPSGDDGHSDCADGTYYYSDAPVEMFVSGKADATAGYSERLWLMLQEGASPKDIQIAPIPLRERGLHVFVDAFVTSTRCEGRCLEAARAFSSFMARAEVLEALLLSKDSGDGAHPRYLLPANVNTYEREGLRGDPLYAQLREASAGAKAYPNVGFEAHRKRLRKELQKALGLPN